MGLMGDFRPKERCPSLAGGLLAKVTRVVAPARLERARPFRNNGF